MDFPTATLNIREGKLGKSRFVPIQATTMNALGHYSERRDAILPGVKVPPFFVSERGRRISTWTAEDNFIAVSRTIGLRSPAVGHRYGRGPRLHDLRHRFAVSTLIHWYRSGADVDREIPKLATYLGHKGPAEVYWYLQAVPELLELATDRAHRATPGGAP